MTKRNISYRKECCLIPTDKLKKKKVIRHNEYYDTQKVFDKLYLQSKNNQNFYKLYDLIISRENILLAYRNIKKNKGSKTKGVNDSTIIHIGEKEPDKLVEYIRNRLSNYQPMAVKRVEIPKPNGKMRPLGIPTIQDRIIQQCIKQILEPICEAKFYKHSYGFRPNRGTHHAIARTMRLMQISQFHYVVDIDIKGFFDNVNHGKLLKQIWSLGIRDKRVISIISKMCKAEIKGSGIPKKGVPQGGILSPLLSNIVLNELDWWIASQWECYDTRHQYSGRHKYRALKKTNLKEVFIVRYADDFKLFCTDRKTAIKIFEATKMWLKERLSLEISSEKSKIINLKKNYSEFLGIKLKLHKKNKKMVVRSHLTDKSIKNCKMKLVECIKAIQREVSVGNVYKYNSTILGMQNYYRVATNVFLDFDKIAFEVNRIIKNRLKNIVSTKGIKSRTYQNLYGHSKAQAKYIQGITLFSIYSIKTVPPMCFSQDICNYTAKGRALIHNKLQMVNITVLRYLMDNPIQGESTEYNDNRLSLFTAQGGKCYVTGNKLKIGDIHVHHKKPRHKGGSDEYKNLVIVSGDVHKLIHATQNETIEKYMKKIENSNMKKLNSLRKKVGNCVIM